MNKLFFQIKGLLIDENTKLINLNNLIKLFIVASFVIWGLTVLNNALIDYKVRKCFVDVIEKTKSDGKIDHSIVNPLRTYCQNLIQ